MKIGIIYLVIINVITAFLFMVDKQRAKKGKWRIRERSLIGLSLMGGSIGALITMYLFRHKTIKFRWILPLIVCLQIVAIAAILLWKAGVRFEAFLLPCRI